MNYGKLSLNERYGFFEHEPAITERKVISNTEGKISKLIFTTYFDVKTPDIKAYKEVGVNFDEDTQELSGAEETGYKLLFLKGLITSLPTDIQLSLVVNYGKNNPEKLLLDLQDSLKKMGLGENLDLKIQQSFFQNADKEWS